MPLTEFLLLEAEYGVQVLAMAGGGVEPAMWTTRPKTVSLPLLAWVLGLAYSFAAVLPYFEELGAA